jgi:hypothetical protein
MSELLGKIIDVQVGPFKSKVDTGDPWIDVGVIVFITVAALIGFLIYRLTAHGRL